MSKCECIQCQGDLVSPLCVEMESTKGCNLQEFGASVEKSIIELEKLPVVDMKTLSSLQNLTRDQIFQILVDQIIALKSSNTTSIGSAICSNVDWTPLNSCTSCPKDFCTQLQNLINITGTLKVKANV